MSSTEIYESIIGEVCDLTRAALIERLLHFNGDLRLDFTRDYLAACDTDRLRHLLLAAEWRARSKNLAHES
jgi:hypothetical protein